MTGFMIFTTLTYSQDIQLPSDNLKKLDQPAYRIYSICAGKLPEMSDAELNLFANTISLAHGDFESQIASLKSRNPSLILVNYINSTYSRPNEEEMRIAENDKRAICMTLAAILDSDISAKDTLLRLRKVNEEPMKILASSTSDAVSSSAMDYVFWIGMEGELMRVNSFDSETGMITVERGYAGTKRASHSRNGLIFSPVYVGQKRQEGGSSGNFPNGSKSLLRYCYDPFSDGGNLIIAKLVLQKINNGYDGAWLDTFNTGDFNLSDCFGNPCRPWDWKNILKNNDGPVEFPRPAFRDGQEQKIKFIQDYVKSETSSYPVIIANNLHSYDLLDTDNDLMMGMLLLSTPEKPRPLDGFCMENYMGQSQKSIEDFENNLLALRKGIKMDLAVMPCLAQAGARAITEDTPARAEFEEFGYAFYLLAILPDQNQRKSMFGTYVIYNTSSGKQIKVHPQYFWPIGKPMDNWNDPSKYTDYEIASHAGVYRREFENAIVLVNSNQESHQIDLGGSFFDPLSGKFVTKIDLVKTSGKILLRQSLSK